METKKYPYEFIETIDKYIEMKDELPPPIRPAVSRRIGFLSKEGRKIHLFMFSFCLLQFVL